ARRGRLLPPALVLAAERAAATDSPRPAVGELQVARLSIGGTCSAVMAALSSHSVDASLIVALRRIGGVLMARGLPQQRETADLVAASGTELCEAGCGPGVRGALLAQQHRQ